MSGEGMWSDREVIEFSYCVSALRKYRETCAEKMHALERRKIRTEAQIERMKQCVSDNSELFEQMAEDAPASFGGVSFNVPFIDSKIDVVDLGNLNGALKSAAREWTALGSEERTQTYGPIIKKVMKFCNQGDKVLVPGAGLCRLALELAQCGYIVNANESAFVMLILAFVALKGDKEFVIHPYLHQMSGLDSVESSLTSAKFPDFDCCVLCAMEGKKKCCHMDPVGMMHENRLLMEAGDFEELAEESSEMYDAVVTSYFIDVVRDARKTIREIYQVLLPGGYWINFGPILLHHEGDDFFSPLTQEDVTNATISAGFQILEDEEIETSYSQNKESHMRTVYRCRLTVARK